MAFGPIRRRAPTHNPYQELEHDQCVPPVRRLPSLTGYRAILFVAAFITHALGTGYFFADQSINTAGTKLPYGTGALAGFFVLSGFVLTWGEPWRSTIGRFWRRRVLKIYPGHMIVWAATLLMLFFVGRMTIGSWKQTEAGPALANLFLVQDWIPRMPYVFSVYGVNWSVSVGVLLLAEQAGDARTVRATADVASKGTYALRPGGAAAARPAIPRRCCPEPPPYRPEDSRGGGPAHAAHPHRFRDCLVPGVKSVASRYGATRPPTAGISRTSGPARLGVRLPARGFQAQRAVAAPRNGSGSP